MRPSRLLRHMRAYVKCKCGIVCYDDDRGHPRKLLGETHHSHTPAENQQIPSTKELSNTLGHGKRWDTKVLSKQNLEVDNQVIKLIWKPRRKCQQLSRDIWRAALVISVATQQQHVGWDQIKSNATFWCLPPSDAKNFFREHCQMYRKVVLG